AAVRAVLLELSRIIPEWHTRSMLDAGAGPGTVAWAAAEIWPDLEQFTMVERDRRMSGLGRSLARHAEFEGLRQARWLDIDLLDTWEIEPHDLIVASYVMGEIPVQQRDELLLRLWERASGVLVLIE